jgi:hypothetical protein
MNYVLDSGIQGFPMIAAVPMRIKHNVAGSKVPRAKLCLRRVSLLT